MQDIKNLTMDELQERLKQWGEPVFHARQIFSWVYKRGLTDFRQMSDLSQGLRERLAVECTTLMPQVEERKNSQDGTQKFLLRLADASLVEAVLIPAQGRVTGCVSTQVGCRWKCCFCASGLLGFRRNLSCAEIVGEALLLRRLATEQPMTHVVFMGTGEPLDNYDAVLKALRVINSADGLEIGARRITISTAGLVPGIIRLAGEGLQVELSVSLHAADDATRSRLMPINKRYPLRDLIAACRTYIARTGRQVTFEYILIRGVNSDLQSARKLATIVQGLKICKVNIIPANPVEECGVLPPQRREISAFRDVLRDAGAAVTLRMPRGTDIEAACGQLRIRHVKV